MSSIPLPWSMVDSAARGTIPVPFAEVGQDPVHVQVVESTRRHRRTPTKRREPIDFHVPTHAHPHTPMGWEGRRRWGMESTHTTHTTHATHATHTTHDAPPTSSSLSKSSPLLSGASLRQERRRSAPTAPPGDDPLRLPIEPVRGLQTEFIEAGAMRGYVQANYARQRVPVEFDVVHLAEEATIEAQRTRTARSHHLHEFRRDLLQRVQEEERQRRQDLRKRMLMIEAKEHAILQTAVPSLPSPRKTGTRSRLGPLGFSLQRERRLIAEASQGARRSLLQYRSSAFASQASLAPSESMKRRGEGNMTHVDKGLVPVAEEDGEMATSVSSHSFHGIRTPLTEDAVSRAEGTRIIAAIRKVQATRQRERIKEFRKEQDRCKEEERQKERKAKQREEEERKSEELVKRMEFEQQRALQHAELSRREREKQRKALEARRHTTFYRLYEANARAECSAQEAISYDGLLRRLLERVRERNFSVPPLCACGTGIFEDHASVCAHNCPFFQNRRAVAEALLVTLQSMNIL